MSSVVQGSGLGPCLFVIFINDIDLAVDTVSLIIKFADDSNSGYSAFQQMFNNLET